MTSAKCLLVVDDEPDMAAYLARVGELAGWSPTQVHSAEALFELADRGLDCDVVILDLVLGTRDGVEILRQLPQLRAGLILVSGYDSKVLDAARQVATARGLRVLGALAKPIRPPELMALLRGFAAQPGPAVALPPGAQRVPVTPAELHQALAQEELRVHVQPQVALLDGAWTGIEALVRWAHPHHGLLLPEAFLDLVQSEGLMQALTRQVATKAMAIAHVAQERLGYRGSVSINLAPSSLTDLSFPEEMAALAVHHGCDPKRLFFEVVETSIPVDATTSLDILTRLRIKGFHLSVDDFGTGYSTLSSLRSLPISELKLDLSFVRPALEDANARKIVEQSIALARDLGLTVVAEGVETERHWQWLRAVGCHFAQGYWIGRPMDGTGLESWLAQWRQTLDRAGTTTARTRRPRHHPGRGGESWRVLVVDPDPVAQGILAGLLREDGYRVKTVAVEEAAWNLLASPNYPLDLVVTECAMPGLDGLGLLARIKGDPRLVMLPVVLQNGDLTAETLRDGLAAGAHYYLAKPYNRHLILALVAAAIEDGERARLLSEQVRRGPRGLRLMERARFRLRTLAEANDLAALLGACCANPEATAMALSELLINAIEHGNLGIGYADKGALMEADLWAEDVRRRLALPEQAGRWVEVEWVNKGEGMEVIISDQGQGFDYRRFLEFDPDRLTHPHGRGIAIARLLGLSSLAYLGSGNQVRVTLPGPGGSTALKPIYAPTY